MTPAQLGGQLADRRRRRRWTEIRPSDQATPASTAGCRAQPRRQRGVDDRETRRPVGCLTHCAARGPSPSAPSTSSIGTDRLANSPIGIPRSRRAPSGVRSTCRQRADPHARRAPAVGDTGDERPEPQRRGADVLAVRDRPAGVEVDDDRNERARQLAEDDGPAAVCGEPLVAQHHAPQRRMRGARDAGSMLTPTPR